VASTEATAVAELLQVPPAVVSVKDVVEPEQIAVAPEIVPTTGAALTVNDVVAEVVPQEPLMV
jgi:hypothetical protein